MQNREFEKKVQQKMEELKFTPAELVWEKIEASLPEEKKRRWIIFMVLFALLLAGSLILWNKANRSKEKENLASGTIVKENEREKKLTAIDKGLPQISDHHSFLPKNSVPIKPATSSTVNTTYKKTYSSSALKIKIKKGDTGLYNAAPENDVLSKNKPLLQTRGATKTKIIAPVTTTDDNEKLTGQDNETTVTVKTNTLDTMDTEVLKKDTPIVAIKKTDSFSIVKNDSSAAVKKQTPVKISKGKWQYGIEFAVGSSSIKNNLFGKGPVYNNSTNISGGGTGQITSTPSRPGWGMAFSAGFYAQKEISAGWKFKTGINYFYQSVSIKVGNKVDTAATFSFVGTSDVSAGSFYQTGNSVNYKSRSQLLEIPLLLQYRFSKTYPVYAETGASVAYLLQSNALIYSANAQSYFTNKNLYNKMFLSFNAGVGITVGQKNALPFTVGCMFKYSVSSLVKKSFGDQHFVNSLFYLRLPLKK